MCSRRAAGLLLHQPGKVNVSLSLCVSRTLSLNSPSPCPLCLFVVLLFHAVMCVCAPHCCGPTVIFYRPSCAQKRRRRKRTRAVLTPKVLLPTTTTTNPYVPTYITSIQLLLLLLALTTYMATLWFLFSFPSAGWMFIFRPHAQRSLLWAFSSPPPHSSLLGDLP
jgi:hypothetical protein